MLLQALLEALVAFSFSPVSHKFNFGGGGIRSCRLPLACTPWPISPTAPCEYCGIAEEVVGSGKSISLLLVSTHSWHLLAASDSLSCSPGLEWNEVGGAYKVGVVEPEVLGGAVDFGGNGGAV